MRDIQLQPGKSFTERLNPKPPKKELFCFCCGIDAANTLESLRSDLRLDLFTVVLLGGTERCVKCNLRSGLLYEIREVA